MSDEFNKDEILEEKTENPDEQENSNAASSVTSEETEETDEKDLKEEINENPEVSEESDFSYTQTETENQTYSAEDVKSLNKIEYSEDLPADDYKPASKGLKLFALVMASVMLLTATCLAGYFIGRNSTSAYKRNKNIDVSLAQVPKNTDALTPAQVYEKVNESIEMGMPEDFYSIDLLDAYESLGSITGETIGEDLVNEIFSKFCMGK